MGKNGARRLLRPGRHGKYDPPAPTVRRAKDDLEGLHHVVADHLEATSQAQREIIGEQFFEGPQRANIAACRGISVNNRDTHRKAACRPRRDSMTTVAEFSTDIDLPDCYGRVEEMSKRHAPSQRRRASSQKETPSSSGGERSSSRGERSSFEDDQSNFGGDQSNFEGDRSNFGGDRDTTARAPDESIGVATESGAARDKTVSDASTLRGDPRRIERDARSTRVHRGSV